MKVLRMVRNLVLLVLGVILCAILALAFLGWQMYTQALEATPLDQKVKQVRAQESYTTFAELPDSLGMHLSMRVRTAVNYARLVWSSMGMLVSGQVGVDQLAGPVGMAEVMADTAKYSMISFFQLVAFISINLGVMNLLPLPALDCGRLVFLIIEGIRRKPVPPRYEGYVHAAGLMLLLMLMVYVTGQDVLRIFMRSN